MTNPGGERDRGKLEHTRKENMSERAAGVKLVSNSVPP
jgi:hypothetical protein